MKKWKTKERKRSILYCKTQPRKEQKGTPQHGDERRNGKRAAARSRSRSAEIAAKPAAAQGRRSQGSGAANHGKRVPHWTAMAGAGAHGLRCRGQRADRAHSSMWPYAAAGGVSTAAAVDAAGQDQL